MSYDSQQTELRLPIEIIVLIITHLPTAQHFLQSACLSRDINTLLQSRATRKEWLLNMPLSPDVIYIANNLRIGLPFEHARQAMEQGVGKSSMKSISSLSDRYLGDALPPFLYNISILQHPLPEYYIVLEDLYMQYFVFRGTQKRSAEYALDWIEKTFGQNLKQDSAFLRWVNQAFETSINDFYTTVAKRIA